MRVAPHPIFIQIGLQRFTSKRMQLLIKEQIRAGI